MISLFLLGQTGLTEPVTFDRVPLLECNSLVCNKRNVSAHVCFSWAVWHFTSVPCSWLWPARQVSICSRKLSVWLLLLIWKVTLGKHISRTALLENCIWCIYSGFILSWAGWLSRWCSKLFPAVGSCAVLWGLCLDCENTLFWQQTFPQAGLDAQGRGTLLNFTLCYCSLERCLPALVIQHLSYKSLNCCL